MRNRFVVLFLLAAFLTAGLWMGGISKAIAQSPIVCKIAEWGSATHPASTLAREYWAKPLQERTKGRIKCDLYYSASLGNPNTYVDLIQSGACDAATIVFAYTPGRFPLSEVMNLPFSWPSGDVANKVFYDLYFKGYFDKELKGFKLLNLGTTGTYNIISTKPIQKLADCKGLKMRSGGGPWTQTLAAWGSIPVAMPASDVYQALERGILDGVALGSGPSYDFKLHEAAKNATVINLGSFGICMGMSWDFYRKLPKDIQQTIDDLFQERVKDPRQGWIYDQLDQIAYKEWPKHGVTIYRPNPEAIKAWKQASRPVIETWINKMEDKGLPGKRLIEDLVAMGKKHGADPY